MQSKGLLVAFIVLAALGGALYWSDKKQKEDEKKPPTDSAVKIVKMETGDVQKVELKRRDGESAVLELGQDNRWSITAPKPMRADQDVVSSLVATLASLNSDKVVDEKPADLAPFGFNSPSIEITITRKGGKATKILVGDDTPTGGGSFVKTAGDSKVYTVTSASKSAFDKSANDLRDKRLLTFDAEKLTRVELVSKGQTVEFGKNAKGDWAILKPKPMRADTLQVDELVRKLREAKMDTAGESTSGGAVVGVAKVTDNSGTQQIEIRKNKDEYFAKSSVVEGTYKVSAELGASFDKKLEDFRNKKVFDFGFNDVTKLEVRDGAKSAAYQKSGEKWMSGSQEMDPVGIQSLIDKLREASAVKFPEAGFPAATFEVTVAYGTSTEKVQFAKAGDKTLAKRDNDPAVFELEGKAFDELQKAASDVKPAQAAKDKDPKKK